MKPINVINKLNEDFKHNLREGSGNNVKADLIAMGLSSCKTIDDVNNLLRSYLPNEQYNLYSESVTDFAKGIIKTEVEDYISSNRDYMNSAVEKTREIAEKVIPETGHTLIGVSGHPEDGCVIETEQDALELLIYPVSYYEDKFQPATIYDPDIDKEYKYKSNDAMFDDLGNKLRAYMKRQDKEGNNETN